MRTTLALLVLAFASSTALADTPIALSASDVAAAVQPHDATIQRCYLDRTTDVYGAGKLSVEIAVRRTGEVDTIAIKTPGLSTRTGTAIANCIVEALDGVTFPARRTHTTATLPYFFQRTYARDAGPQLSCWNPAGCPDTPRVAATPKRDTKRAARRAHVARR